MVDVGDDGDVSQVTDHNVKSVRGRGVGWKRRVLYRNGRPATVQDQAAI
jgi:hypothetical protein